MGSQSIESQDLFVLACTDNKRNGTYLEVGGRWPIQANNTFLLEKGYDWRGVSVEWDAGFTEQWAAQRSNPCVTADATILNYDALLTEHGLGPHVDYLQIDIDPATNSLRALELVDFNKYTFGVITFEHEYDKKEAGLWVREMQREMLRSAGYFLVVADVCCSPDHSFEDWWVSPEHMPNRNWEMFIGERVLTHRDVVKFGLTMGRLVP